MGQNDKIREAAEEIFTRENHYNILEAAFRLDCACSNMNERKYMILCDRHKKSYNEEMTRIMRIIEKTNDSIIHKLIRVEDENEHLRKKLNPYERDAIKQHNMSGDSGGF